MNEPESRLQLDALTELVLEVPAQQHFGDLLDVALRRVLLRGRVPAGCRHAFEAYPSAFPPVS